MANLFDSTNYPVKEPLEVTAGDTWTWKRTDLGSDYDPASYSLTYTMRLEGGGATKIDITCTADGTDYIASVAAATTNGYTAGRYQWQAYITRTSDSARVMVDDGVMTVLANRTSATTDPRSHARICLENIQAVLESRASQDQQNYSIAGRSLGRMLISDLLKLRDYYRHEVDLEDRAVNGLKARKLTFKL